MPTTVDKRCFLFRDEFGNETCALVEGCEGDYTVRKLRLNERNLDFRHETRIYEDITPLLQKGEEVSPAVFYEMVSWIAGWCELRWNER